MKVEIAGHAKQHRGERVEVNKPTKLRVQVAFPIPKYHHDLSHHDKQKRRREKDIAHQNAISFEEDECAYDSEKHHASHNGRESEVQNAICPFRFTKERSARIHSRRNVVCRQSSLKLFSFRYFCSVLEQ